MNSNYTFAFNRRPVGPPGLGPRSLAVPVVPRSLVVPSRSLASNRFSINRLINYKSPGGCRSCN